MRLYEGIHNTSIAGSSFESIRKNRAFLLLLASQGISNIGDGFQLIALPVLLYNMTGSGLTAGFGLILSVLPGVVLAPFAGGLGDIIEEKRMLIMLDLLRGVTVFFFAAGYSLSLIYVLTVLISSLDVLYNPPRKKIIVNVLERKHIMTGNSLLSGISGVAFIFGPLLAGIMTDLYGVNLAFYVNSLTYVVSALIISMIEADYGKAAAARGRRKRPASLFKMIIDGYWYYKDEYMLKKYVIIGTVVSFGTISLNIAFYPFAFDILKVTGRGWGVMMSIFYGTNFVSMLILIVFGKKIKSMVLSTIYVSLFAMSVIWFLYGSVNNLAFIMLLQLLEGTVQGLCTVLISTQLQVLAQNNFIGRIMGFNDIFNNIGKIAGMIYAYAVISRFSPRTVFRVNSVVILIFLLYSTIYINFSAGRSVFKNRTFL